MSSELPGCITKTVGFLLLPVGVIMAVGTLAVAIDHPSLGPGPIWVWCVLCLVGLFFLAASVCITAVSWNMFRGRMEVRGGVFSPRILRVLSICVTILAFSILIRDGVTSGSATRLLATAAVAFALWRLADRRTRC